MIASSDDDTFTMVIKLRDGRGKVIRYSGTVIIPKEATIDQRELHLMEMTRMLADQIHKAQIHQGRV